MRNINIGEKQKVRSFLNSNLSYCGFALGNIDMENCIIRIREDNSNIICMYTIILEKFITYVALPNCEEKFIIEMIKDSLKYKFIEGTIIGNYSNILRRYFELPKNYMNEVAYIFGNDKKFENHTDVQELKIENIEEYKNAINSIKEFKNQSVEYYKDSFYRSKMVVIFDNDKIVAGATISALSDTNGVIIGVFTVEGYRRLGYAKKCVETLLAKYLNNRTICIFFNNKNAKDLYLKIGFNISENLIMFNRKVLK